MTILGKVEGLEREILQPFGGIYRNPTTISTLTQPPCFVGILSYFFFGGGKKQTNLKIDLFFVAKRIGIFKGVAAFATYIGFFSSLSYSIA